jgi:hypothetical protein
VYPDVFSSITHQAERIFADELFTDYESLRQTVRTRLLGVGQLDAVQAAITPAR